ncbi:MAG: hypothetical protein ACC642_04250, partial [Pseudomonadales bacterium]
MATPLISHEPKKAQRSAAADDVPMEEQTVAVADSPDAINLIGEPELISDSPNEPGVEPTPESGKEQPDTHSLAERLEFQSEQLLDPPSLLDELIKEGFISQRQAEDILIAPRTKKELSQHPMEIVADREYENRLNPGHTLDLDTMTLWLADKARQPYVRIDPL